MFDSYKDRLRKIELHLDYLADMQRDNIAMTQLQKLFADGFFMPLTTWSIAPSEVLHICNDIEVNKRQSIIEFGAGFSTLCIAKVLEITGSKAHFYAVESDADWLASMQHNLQRHGLAERVVLVHAPVSEVSAAITLGGPQQWYSTAALDAALRTAPHFDLVVVDGPFGKIAPHARYPALPYLQKCLAKQFAIFLDDATRQQEQEIARHWETLLGIAPTDHKRYLHFANTKGFDAEPFGQFSI